MLADYIRVRKVTTKLEACGHLTGRFYTLKRCEFNPGNEVWKASDTEGWIKCQKTEGKVILKELLSH